MIMKRFLSTLTDIGTQTIYGLTTGIKGAA